MLHPLFKIATQTTIAQSMSNSTSNGRRKVFCIKYVLLTPCITVSMLALSSVTRWMMNLRLEDGKSKRTQH